MWSAARSRGYPRILAAALLLAAIPLTNWLAGFSLAICSALLLLAAWGNPEFRAWRVFVSAGLAYLLACFWLTPTFVRVIANNWPVDSFAYRLGMQQVWAIALAAVGAIVIRIVFAFCRGPFYFCFVTLGAFVFGSIATAYYIYGVDTIPESRRYAIEFEFFLVLALVEAIRLSTRSKNGTVRLSAIGAAAVMLLVGAPQITSYLTQAWQKWMPAPPETTVEYCMAQWIAAHPPAGRVFASGGLRFRLNSWFDIPQVGGGFETGLRNRVPVELAYQIRAGAENALLRLKALGAQYVVIHGPNSREYYRDIVHPQRIASALPPFYHVEDDTVYELPPRPIAHLVADDDLVHGDILAGLTRYVAAIENPARPALQVAWSDTSTISIAGPVRPGDLVSIQVNADPGWQAVQDGRPLPIANDALGFIVLRPAAAQATRIDLHYRGTPEQRVMLAVSLLTWIGALYWLFRGRTSPSSQRPLRQTDDKTPTA
jgi:hypothetical protein